MACPNNCVDLRDAYGRVYVCNGDQCLTQAGSIAQVQEAGRKTEEWKAGLLTDSQYENILDALLSSKVDIAVSGISGSLLETYQANSGSAWYAVAGADGTAKTIDLTSASGVQYQTALGLSGYLPQIVTDKYGGYSAYSLNTKAGGEILLSQWPAGLEGGLALNQDLNLLMGKGNAPPLLALGPGLPEAGVVGTGAGTGAGDTGAQRKAKATVGAAELWKRDASTLLIVGGVAAAGIAAAVLLMARKPRRASPAEG